MSFFSYTKDVTQIPGVGEYLADSSLKFLVSEYETESKSLAVGFSV